MFSRNWLLLTSYAQRLHETSHLFSYADGQLFMVCYRSCLCSMRNSKLIGPKDPPKRSNYANSSVKMDTHIDHSSVNLGAHIDHSYGRVFSFPQHHSHLLMMSNQTLPNGVQASFMCIFEMDIDDSHACKIMMFCLNKLKLCTHMHTSPSDRGYSCSTNSGHSVGGG